MTKRTRSAISKGQKAQLRAQHHLKPYLSNLQLQKWFQETYERPIDPSSISRILSSRNAFLDDLDAHQLNDKRRRTEQWPELDQALFEWIQRAESQIAISQEVIREKAKQYWGAIYPQKAMPSFSNGWLRGFQTRKNIKNNIRHGEAESLSQDAESAMISIRQLLSVYEPRDIFNCDETGLYWKLIPDRSLTSRTVSGRKKEKARISAHFCCNADASERLPIWFIGTAKRPRAFTAAGVFIENLNCCWRSNKKAWMTTVIFKEWLQWFDRKMAGRKVVLLMDNFSAHEAAYQEIGQLSNTLVIWLPSNSTTRFQPLDQGIIRTWKAYWKRQWVLYMMAEFDNGVDPLSTMTILTAIRWSISAWEFDLSSEAIRNCFTKALTPDQGSASEISGQDLTREIEQGLQQLQLSNSIQEAMDIKQFLNPAEEQVTDDLMAIDDIVLSHHTAPTQEEESDDEIEALPIVTASEAVDCLRKLRLYEEQQYDANQGLIQQLRCSERDILRRKARNQQQSDIRHYF